MNATRLRRRSVLISYSRADQAWADWIGAELTRHGLEALLQVWDYRPHEPLPTEIARAMTGTEPTIAVLSPAYLTALQTRPEWASALSRHPGSGAGRFLAVCVRPCAVKKHYADMPFLDLVGIDEAQARDILLRGLTRMEHVSTERVASEDVSAEAPYPGAEALVWDVPHPRNPTFTGRERNLSELRRALESSGAAVLTGLPGAGKSQVALEYAYRHATRYALVWWLSSEHRGADFARLENEIRDQMGAADDAATWLRERDDWLLIFDDVQAAAELDDILPPKPAGHVIAVSRSVRWRDGQWPSVLIDSMVPAKAIELLLKRTGQNDERAAAEVAEGLGRLPLALEMAAQVMLERSLTLAQYADDLFGRSIGQDPERSQLPAFVAEAAELWGSSFDELREESPAAEDVLHLCSFYGPRDIPSDLLAADVERLPAQLASAASQPDDLQRAFALLHLLGFARVTNAALSISSLIQAATRHRLGTSAATWAEAAVEVANAAFPFASDDPSTWSACGRLRPHALSAVDHAERLGVASGARVRLLNQVGLYLLQLGEPEEAKNTLERAYALVSLVFDAEASEAATVLNNLGGAMEALGDLTTARSRYQLALDIDVQTLGADHPQVAIRLTNLGSVLERMGQVREAKELYERALQIDWDHYGEDGPDVAMRLSNLGGILERLGDLDGAHEKYRRALEIQQSRTGANAADAATIHNNLGTVLWRRGALDDARDHLERALEIAELAHGPSHPELQPTLVNLGAVLHRLGDLLGAQAHLERAFDIALAGAGMSVEALSAAARLGDVQEARGDPYEASRTFQRGLDIARETFGPDSLESARMLGRLADANTGMRDLVGARDRLTEAIAIAERSQASSSELEMAANLGKLGHVLQALDEPDEAREALHRALEAYLSASGPEDPDVPAVRELTAALQGLGDLDGARAHLLRALPAVEARKGVDHPATAGLLDELGLVLIGLRDLEQARECLQRAAAIYEAALGPDDPTVATTLRNLGGALKLSGRLHEAREHFLRAAAIHGTSREADRGELALDLANLGIVDEELGDLASARASYNGALKILECSPGVDDAVSQQVRDRLVGIGGVPA